MRLCMVSVYDKAVSAYMPPFTVRSKGEAARAFMDLVRDGKSAVAQHPSDYAILFLGEFDDSDGSFSRVDATPVVILDGITARDAAAG